MKIFIRQHPDTLNEDLFLFERSDGFVTFYNIDPAGNGLLLTTKKHNEGQVDEAKPFVTMPDYQMRDFVRAMIGYAREQGFKGADESFAKGKLEATEKHLEDMRLLLGVVPTTSGALQGGVGKSLTQ